MKRSLRICSYVAVWLLCTLAGGSFGAWWPIRDVAVPWTGDGIGILVFGILGLIAGALLGILIVATLASAHYRQTHRA
jgi:hypothetical protein